MCESVNYAQKVAANNAFGAFIPSRYRILRVDRANGYTLVNAIVYESDDIFGSACDDTANTGITYVCVSDNPLGVPFFTIPRDDIERL
jgi:hypothetical protein